MNSLMRDASSRIVLSGLAMLLSVFSTAACGELAAADESPLQFLVHPGAMRDPGLALKPEPVTLAAGRPIVLSVAFTGKGETMIAVDAHGTVQQWDLPGGKLSTLRAGGEHQLTCAALSADGRLAVATLEGRVMLYELNATPQTARPLEAADDRTVALKFSADGKVLVGAASSGHVNVWAVETDDHRTLVSGCEGDVQALAIAPDSSWLAVAAMTGPVKILDLTQKSAPREIGVSATSLAFSPASDALAIGGGDGVVRLVSMAASNETRSMLAHTFGVWAVAFAPDGSVLASASWDGTIKLWETSSGRQLASQKAHEESVSLLAFAPEARGLVSASIDGKLNYWASDVPRISPWATLSGHPGQVWVAAFSSDGRTLLTGGAKNSLALWDVPDNKLIAALKGHETTRCAAFSPDGELFVTGGSDGQVWLWDCRTRRKQAVLKGHPGAISAVAFSPDAARLVSACDGKIIKLWDVARREETATWRGHQEQIYCASFSPDGRWLASGGGDWAADVPGELKLWEVEKDAEPITLSGHRLSVWTVSFSPDGTRLATSSSDGTVKIWDLGNFSLERTLTYGTWLRPLNFSPDGRRLAVGRGDGPVRLWDTTTWQEQASLDGHDGFTFWLEFSPDGEMIATAGSDGTARLWRTNRDPLPTGPNARRSAR